MFLFYIYKNTNSIKQILISVEKGLFTKLSNIKLILHTKNQFKNGFSLIRIWFCSYPLILIFFSAISGLECDIAK